jgi:hypothetical protein
LKVHLQLLKLTEAYMNVLLSIHTKFRNC